MDIRELIKSLLLIFVVFSFAFLTYKEFSPRNENDVIKKGETSYAYDNPTGTNETKAIKKPETLPQDQVSLSQNTIKSHNSKVIAYYSHGTF